MSVAAVRKEALDESITIVWRDHKFEVLPPDNWMFEFAHCAERNQTTMALESMLGPEQYEVFRAARPKLSDVTALIEQATSGFGIDTGEALASSA